MTDDIFLVRAGQMVTAHDQPAVRDGAVAVSGDTIKAVGSYAELSQQYPDAKEIGGERFLLIPGLINGHGHGRGLSDFQRGNLDNTLESWLWSCGKYVPVSVYDDLAMSAVRLLKSGVTTGMHNHIFTNPAAYEAELEEGLKAFRDVGMRVQFNPGVRNNNPLVYGDNKAFMSSLPEFVQKALSVPPPEGALTGDNFVEVVSDFYSWHNGPMSRIGFGPISPQWSTDDLLIEVRKAADRLGAPIHIHAVQSIFQKIYGLETYGKTLIEYMNDIGLLGRGLVIGHCTWPTESDIELLASTGTAVTHHPSCNLRVRNGISPVFHMLRAGVLVGLGMDGKSINDDDDMIQEMKVCFLLQRLPSLELDSPHLSARQVFQMVTENNAALLGHENELGRLEVGKLADLVLLDYDEMCRPYVDPSQDPIDTLLYRGVGRHVHTVVVNGEIVVQDGELLTVDENALAGRLAEAASRPRTEQEEARGRVMDEVRRHVIEYYKGWSDKVEIKPFIAANSRTNGLKQD